MTSRVSRVLIADDQRDVILALRLLLGGEGLEVDEATSVAEVRSRMEFAHYDLLLMDLNYARDTTSGAEGLALVADVRARDPFLPVLVMTGWSSVETAVEAMRRGACGFVHKPWDNAALVDEIRREIQRGRTLRQHQHRTGREQHEAQAIQRALLPPDLPEVPGCDIAVRWTAASGFGGDWYDVAVVSTGRLALCIGDVCGKGLPAALLMANVQASARAFTAADMPPSAVVTSLNRDLLRHVGLHRFVTLCCAVYDPASHRLTYSNAGHIPPIVLHPDGSVTLLEAGGTVVGAFCDSRYDEESIELRSGDRLVMFTDGIAEAGPSPDCQFADERLLDVLRQQRPAQAARPIVDAVFEAAASFAGGEFQDDATVLAFLIQ